MSTVPHGKYSGRRLLIVGCGYVGTAVAEQAQQAGMEVSAITRNTAAAEALRLQGIKAVVADAAEDAWYDEIQGAPDFLLDCLGSGDGTIDGYRRSYVEGMQSILEWARSRGAAGTLVYTSSTSVYPQGGGVRVGESDSVENAGASADARSEILREAERRLMNSHGACGRWFILRLAGIYGPGRHALLDQVKAGAVSGSGEHHLNVAHRDDIVRAIFACFAAPSAVAGGTFNVADDGPERKRVVAEWLAARLDLPAPAFTGQPAMDRRAVTPDRVITNGKIKVTLGWRPRFPTFREGYDALLSAAR